MEKGENVDAGPLRLARTWLAYDTTLYALLTTGDDVDERFAKEELDLALLNDTPHAPSQLLNREREEGLQVIVHIDSLL